MNLNYNFLLPLLLALIEHNDAASYVGTPPQMKQLQTLFEWQQLQFGFPSVQQQQQAIASGDLVVENATPIDVQPHYGGRNRFRLFVTIPRFATGIPYSLATVASEKGPKGQFLQAYPNYDWHNRQDRNCDKITSAFRVVINECNQMWVIDSGVIGSEQVCAPQLLLFDLNTDQMIHRFRFDSSLYIPAASLFITPLSIVPNGKCEKAKLYIADVSRHGLVVYDRATNAAWRIENKFMYPDPDYGTHTIAGESFTLMDGIFSLVSDKRNLYFHPLASRNEYAVSLDLLNNRTMWTQNMEAAQTSFIHLGHRRSECAASAIDRSMNIYCVTFNPVQLIAWHVNTPYGSKNFAAIPVNARHLEFVSGMKVVASPNGDEELWMLSNRFQKIAAGTINSNEANFRILRRSLSDIQGGLFSGAFQSDLLNRLVFN